MRVRLKQLAQEAAAAGQAMVWNGSVWAPARAGVGHSSLTSQVVATTSSAPWIDAFVGGTVSAPEAGTYLITFNVQLQGSATSTEIAIALSINSLVAPIVESVRLSDVGNGFQMGSTQTILAGLVPGDLIRGLFGKQAGAGNASVGSRRITMVKVVA